MTIAGVIPAKQVVIPAKAGIQALFVSCAVFPIVYHNFMKNYYVYILCSKKNGTLYIGVTSDLNRRVQEHGAKLVPGFTAKYSVTRLVYFEVFDSALVAIRREKCLKKWSRAWKLRLIEEANPEWKDLYCQD